jgi:sensor histidine kinase YesM
VPLGQALVGYLRATLPLFDRPLLALGEEARAAEHYLRVMQLRLGQRLAWRIDIEPALAALPLPPGLVLALVENAVEHGVEPQPAGGEVALTATREGHEAVVVVQDNGPGLAPGARDGVGLANSRERLALTHGSAARLTLAAAEGGGCRAEVRVPISATEPSRKTAA